MIDRTAVFEALRDELSEWEVFEASDGYKSIRMKERTQTPGEILDRIFPLMEDAVRSGMTLWDCAEMLSSRAEIFGPTSLSGALLSTAAKSVETAAAFAGEVSHAKK